MKEHYGCIYKIVCKVNDKLYIGQTIRGLSLRWKSHCHEAKKKSDKNKLHISRAIHKYGESNFSISVICWANSQEELNDREKLCIKLFGSMANGYNIHEGGRNQRLSAATRKKISDGNKGKKRTQESRERYRRARLGTIQPEHVRIKCSESQKGEKSSWFGRKHSEESKKKIRDGNIGKIVSDAQKQKQKKAMTGRKASLETKQKMSIKRKGRKPNQKRVRCVTTGLEYESVKLAAYILGMAECTAALGLRNKKTVKGYLLEYV